MLNDRPKVLYLDDEKPNLDVFYYSFTDDFDISLAIDPNQAIIILETQPIQILLVDQRMPEITGIDFLKSIKTTYPDIISIIVTAFANLNDVIAAVNEISVYRFLTKPWNQHHIKHTIFEAYNVYQLKQNNKKLVQELKCQYEELDKAYQLAKNSDNLKSIFIKNLSHEIRTPLNGILGFAQLLLDQPLDYVQVYKYATFINQSGLQLAEIIDDLLTISIIQSDKINAFYSHFDLKVLVAETVELFKRINTNYDIELFYIFKPDLPETVHCDQEKLRKILEKIIGNALKFTQKGFVEIICSSIHINDLPYFKIEITDTGTGIKQDDLDKIFKPFAQLIFTPDQFISGMGTGLVICKAFTETLKGSISLTSEYGKGSVFSVILPVNKPE